MLNRAFTISKSIKRKMTGSNPGGDCAVALNKRCCENDGVWRQKQVFHCQCNTGFSAGTTKGLPSCVKSKRYYSLQEIWLEDAVIYFCENIFGN